MEILLTTIGVPSPREDAIPRPRLLEALREGLARKVLLIMAEAGYGKSTLMAQLAHTLDWPVAWYTIAESGRDPGTFLASVIAALEEVRPGTTFTAHQLLNSLPDPAGSWRAVADALINDLVRSAPDAVLLVLDDAHLLAESPAAPIPGYLAAHLPRSVRLALLSRSPLSSPEIARISGQGDVIHLDARALAFTSEEASDLLRGQHDAALPPDVVDLAQAQTEGWAVALHLLRQVLQEGGGATAADAIRALGHTRRELYEYFVTQVLGRLPSDLGRFLVQISILEFVDADLAAAVTGIPDAHRLLRDLEGRGLFLTLIDPDAGRYLLHPLFRETLQAHLIQQEGPEEIRRLHRAAGTFLAKADRADQAIPYLLRGGDHAAVAAHLAGRGERWLDEGKGRSVGDWISALPPESAEHSVPLLLLLGLIADRRGDWPEALRTCAAAAALATGDLAGVAMTGQGKALFRLQRYEEAKRTSEEALRLDGLTGRTRARLLHRVATCHPWLGTPLEAVGLYAQARALFEQAGDLRGQLDVLHDLALLYQTLHLEPDWAEPLLPHAAALYRRADSPMTRGDAARLMGELLAARQEYDRALIFLEEAGESARLLDDLHRIALCYFYRGSALLDAGRLHEARGVLLEGLRIAEERRAERYIVSLHFPLALIDWREGRAGEAARYFRQNLDYHARQNNALFIPGLQILVALASTDAADRDEAKAHFLAARERLTAWGAERRAAECALYLTALDLQFDSPDSDGPALSGVLESARRHRLDHIFKEHRELLAPLLTRAITDDVEADYAGSLLALLGDSTLLAAALSHSDPAVRQRGIAVLERMEGEETRILLSRATKDPDPAVRSKARAVLAEVSKRPPPTLTIRLFGGFEVRRGDTLVPASAWQRRRDRLLLAYLLIATGPVLRDVLLDALWPDLTPSSAAASLKVAWSRLKRALEPMLPEGVPSVYLAIDGPRYTLRWNAVATDVQEFSRLVAGAERTSDPDEQVSLLQAAVEAYRGDLLPEYANEPWTVVERERLRSLSLSALERLAEGRARQGRPEEALEYLRTVLRLEPWREEATRRVMQILAGIGRHSEALHLYRQCEALLRRELGVAPAPETTALFETIASGRPL